MEFDIIIFNIDCDEGSIQYQCLCFVPTFFKKRKYATHNKKLQL